MAATVLIGIVLVLGLSRVRLDVDVFTLLPSGSGMVDALRLYQKSFGSS
jgi:predicted RND superfamily exporter protein